MSLRKFLLSKLFFKHLIISLIGGLILLWLIILFLGFYVKRGGTFEIPDMVGMQLHELKQEIDPKAKFRYIVIDSIYDDRYEKGAIVQQDPPLGSKVKRGRKIYLTVVAMQPETVNTPDFVDLTLRQALANIKAAGLTIERLTYIPNMAKNAVLDQKFEGKNIKPGTKILKGSAIELILGKGLQDETVEVPYLIEKTLAEAIALIHQSSLNVGYLSYSDTTNNKIIKVYRQRPLASEEERVDFGAAVDLWVTGDTNFNFNAYKRENIEIIPESDEDENIDDLF